MTFPNNDIALLKITVTVQRHDNDRNVDLDYQFSDLQAADDFYFDAYKMIGRIGGVGKIVGVRSNYAGASVYGSAASASDCLKAYAGMK